MPTQLDPWRCGEGRLVQWWCTTHFSGVLSIWEHLDFAKTDRRNKKLLPDEKYHGLGTWREEQRTKNGLLRAISGWRSVIWNSFERKVLHLSIIVSPVMVYWSLPPGTAPMAAGLGMRKVSQTKNITSEYETILHRACTIYGFTYIFWRWSTTLQNLCCCLVVTKYRCTWYLRTSRRCEFNKPSSYFWIDENIRQYKHRHTGGLNVRSI